MPVHEGRAVSYRPPRWAGYGREGSIEVPAGCPLLIIEGDGAGRQEVADLIDALIWVQSDQREAGQRSLARAGRPDPMDLANMAADGSPPDESGWMAEEIPFNAAQRTWERADVMASGTPELPCEAESTSGNDAAAPAWDQNSPGRFQRTSQHRVPGTA